MPSAGIVLSNQPTFFVAGVSSVRSRALAQGAYVAKLVALCRTMRGSSMQQNSRRLTKVIMGVLGVLALASLGMPRAVTADEVFDWNVTGFEATAEGGQNPIIISRTMTMVHLA